MISTTTNIINGAQDFSKDGIWFRDLDGRYLFFRGVNFASRSKLPPYLPIAPLNLKNIDELNLKQEIEKEIGKDEKIEEILSTCISMSYLEIIMFEKFKDECEMCYEKAEKVLKKMVKDDEKRKIIIEKAKEWIKNWMQ